MLMQRYKHLTHNTLNGAAIFCGNSTCSCPTGMINTNFVSDSGLLLAAFPIYSLPSCPYTANVYS